MRSCAHDADADSGADSDVAMSGTDGTHTQATHAPGGRWMILVCGVMASGKSTFTAALQAALNGMLESGGWQVVAQDDIPQANAHAAACDVVLGLRRESVIVDRINSDAAQRRVFTAVAQRNHTDVLCVHIHPPAQTCVAQLRRRGEEHRRFPWSPENAHRVRKTHKAFELPDVVSEGIHDVLTIATPEDRTDAVARVVAIVCAPAENETTDAATADVDHTPSDVSPTPGAKRSFSVIAAGDDGGDVDMMHGAPLKRRCDMRELLRRTSDLSIDAR